MTADKHTEDELDRALEDPAFAELISALRAEAGRPAPPVSPQLGLLLSTGAAPAPRRRGVRGATVGLVVVGVVAGGVGAAAAAGHLPQSLRSVSDVGEHRAPRPVTGEDEPTSPTSPTDFPPPSTANDDLTAEPTTTGLAEAADTAAARSSDEGSPSGRDGRPASQGSTGTSDGDDREESEDTESGPNDEVADTDDAGSTQTDDDGEETSSEDGEETSSEDGDSGASGGGDSDADDDDPDDDPDDDDSHDGGDSSSGDGADVDD